MNLFKKIFHFEKEPFSRNNTVADVVEGEKIFSKFRDNFNITFQNPVLLITAFKHRSYLNITNEDRAASNERLEFLGDAVLDLVVTEYLYRKFPKRTEGQLSKIKSVLVSKPVLAEIAVALSFGELILINKGEEKTGGRQRQSILSDTFEAIVGALYLDQGLEAASSFINTYLLSKFKTIIQKELYANYKSMLLEHTQSHFNNLPEYRVIQEVGPDHDKEFIIAVFLDGREVGRGQGKSKKLAEQEAAKRALQELGLVNGDQL